MSKDFIYKTDIGTLVRLNIVEHATGAAVTVTGATSASIEVQKPSGVTTSWSAAVSSTAVAIEHIVSSGDLDETGHYLLRPKFTLGGWSGRGRAAVVEVLDITG